MPRRILFPRASRNVILLSMSMLLSASLLQRQRKSGFAEAVSFIDEPDAGKPTILADLETLMCRFKAAFSLPLSRKIFRIAAEQAPHPYIGC